MVKFRNPATRGITVTLDVTRYTPRGADLKEETSESNKHGWLNLHWGKSNTLIFKLDRYFWVLNLSFFRNLIALQKVSCKMWLKLNHCEFWVHWLRCNIWADCHAHSDVTKRFRSAFDCTLHGSRSTSSTLAERAGERWRTLKWVEKSPRDTSVLFLYKKMTLSVKYYSPWAAVTGVHFALKRILADWHK